MSIALPFPRRPPGGAARQGTGGAWRPAPRADHSRRARTATPAHRRLRRVQRRRGRLLLARAAPSLTLRGRWFLPGGGVQHGENPTDSLRREIEEETGLTVELGPLLDVISDVRTAARRYEPAHGAADLPGDVVGGDAARPRPTERPTPSGGSPRTSWPLSPWPTTSKRWWTHLPVSTEHRRPTAERHHVVIIGSRLRRPLCRQGR